MKLNENSIHAKLYSWFWNEGFFRDITEEYSYWEYLSIMGGILLIVGIICLAFYLLMHLSNKIENYNRKDNMVSEWIKAKKNKYCPIIKWIKK